MTGIERLRQMAEDFKNVKTAEHCTFIVNTWRGMYIDDAIADIADQIEREHAEDCFRMGERAADVSMSAYDLLPQEEREAIAWVREHGGLDAVRKMAAITLDVYQRLVDGNVGLEMLETDADTIDSMMAEIDEAIVKRGKERMVAQKLLEESVPRVTYERHIIKRQRQIDESHAALRRRNERVAELEHERDDLREMVRQLNASTDEMEKRLMPEGMEWLAEMWPRFENSEPLSIGDEVRFKIRYCPMCGRKLAEMGQ